MQIVHVAVHLFVQRKQEKCKKLAKSNQAKFTLAYKLNADGVCQNGQKYNAITTDLSAGSWNVLGKMTRMTKTWYLKFNFKAGLFSSTFWFEHSFRCKNAI